jgi:CMP-N,N'-diacetyllegionaminic acid synthase
MKKDIIAFIPARAGSKRIKNKNLRKIEGQSLVAITIKTAIDSKVFKEIYLSSNSNKILSEGKKLKINTVERDEKYSDNKVTMDKTLLDFIIKNKIKNSYIVILQPTSPLRTTQTIKSFVNYSINKKLKKCLTVSIMQEQIGILGKYFRPLHNYGIRNSQSRIKYIFENSLMYFLDVKHFLKTKNIYDKNWSYFITNKYESIDINDIEDYKFTKKINNENK